MSIVSDHGLRNMAQTLNSLNINMPQLVAHSDCSESYII